jgi:hypothetical protein
LTGCKFMISLKPWNKKTTVMITQHAIGAS